MDFAEKARIRMEHWIAHNDQHHEEYEGFARQLEEAGFDDSARQLREMGELAAKSNTCLRQALQMLEK